MSEKTIKGDSRKRDCGGGKGDDIDISGCLGIGEVKIYTHGEIE